MIRNCTDVKILNVTAIHHPTRKQVSTSLIPPGQEFNLAFSPRILLSDAVGLSWEEKGVKHQVTIDLLEQRPSSGCTMLSYEIHPNGKALARFSN